MTASTDLNLEEVRERVHTINNALNVISMQAEMVRLMANGHPNTDKIGTAIDKILSECKNAGAEASAIGNCARAAQQQSGE